MLAVPATLLSVVVLSFLRSLSGPDTQRLVIPYVTFSHSQALLQSLASGR